jgi:cyclic pyranopterin monophosphate synthase
MEALTAVTTAALTIYDMLKYQSSEIAIESIHLVQKTGGKNEYQKTF